MNKTVRIIILAFLTLICAVVLLVPFLWTALTALKPTPEVVKVPPTFLPENPTFENFSYSWRAAPFLLFYMNSLIVTVIITASVVLFSSMAGFALAKYQFRGKELVFFYFLGTMVIPFEIIMLPLFFFMNKFGLVDTYLGLILPSLITAFGIFMMRQFISTVPNDLLDAARIDGCKEFWIFYRIVIPLVKAAVATLVIFTFLANWDDFLWPLIIIESMKMQTIPLGLAMFASRFEMQAALTWNVQMAATLISIVPVLIVFVIMQRHIIEGISFTGLKG